MDARKTTDLRLRDAGIKQPQCSATAKSGTQCKKRAVTGSTVCGTHGGLAPQVREAGLRRTEEAVRSRYEKALKVLDQALEEGDYGVAWKFFNAMAALEGVLDKGSKPSEPEVELKVIGVDGRPVDKAWAPYASV